MMLNQILIEGFVYLSDKKLESLSYNRYWIIYITCSLKDDFEICPVDIVLRIVEG